MVILLVPNLGCQLRCSYCFEDERPITTTVNTEAMKTTLALLEENPRLKGSTLALHGGEPTLADRDVFEDLVKFASQRCEPVILQTNGMTMDGQLLDIICKYKMTVGVSIDGPGVLNSLRGPDPSNRAITRKYTDKVHRNIRRLCNAGVTVGTVSVLHEINVGTNSRLQKFENWLVQLQGWGVSSTRLNLLYATNETAQQYELSPEKAAGAWIALYEFRKMHQLRLYPLIEMIQNLKGATVAPCHYCQCDRFSTHCMSILPNGSISNCDRTFGSEYHLRSSRKSHPGRYAALQLNQCKDCRYWNVCHGGCPMEGFNGDWRNKTRNCAVIFNLYAWIERDLTATFNEVNLNAR